jgi:hypothetical protein
MRVAETRAVNRAHVTVYGVALCSLEVRPPWPLSPEQLSVLRRTLQYRPPFQKGVLPAAPTNSSRFRRVVSILAGLSQKNPRKCQSAMYTYGTGHEGGAPDGTMAAGRMGWRRGSDGASEGPAGCATGCT